MVQGVGFRYATVREAERLKLAGWVRNRRCGEVEAVICGDPAAVAAMIAWARHGPPSAEVEHVHVELADGDYGNFGNFEQRPTE